MILSLDHAQITVPKDAEEQARKFYCAFLGLSETDKPANRKKNGGFWLQLGDCQIHIGLEDGFDRSTTKSHLAYRVDNLSFWRNKFQEENIEFKESAPFPKASAFEFRDPFGNRVELIQQEQ